MGLWAPAYVRDHAVHLAVVAALAAYPFAYEFLTASGLGEEFETVLPPVRTMVVLLYFSLFAMSFDFVSGYTGYLSFGHAAFYGAGAYFVVLAANDQVPLVGPETSFVVLLVLAGLLGAVMALLIGAVSFRLTGVYFAMITLGFAEVLYVFVQNWDYVGTNPRDGAYVTGRTEGFEVGVPYVDGLNLRIGRLTGDAVSLTDPVYMDLTALGLGQGSLPVSAVDVAVGGLVAVAAFLALAWTARGGAVADRAAGAVATRRPDLAPLVARVTVVALAAVAGVVAAFAAAGLGIADLVAVHAPGPEPASGDPDVVALGGTEVSYYMVGLVVLACYFAMQRILHSPFGRVMVAIRENEERARAVGYDTFRYKMAAFGMSAFFAGVAGALFAGYARSVAPDNTFFFLVTGFALLAAIIGGFGTLSGPLYGYLFFLVVEHVLTKDGGGLLPYLRANLGEGTLSTGLAGGLTVGEFIETFLNGHADLYIGVVFVLFVLYVPGGLLGSARARLGGHVSRELPARMRAAAAAASDQFDDAVTRDRE